jgi:hypothetical protein
VCAGDAIGDGDVLLICHHRFDCDFEIGKGLPKFREERDESLRPLALLLGGIVIL